MKRSYIFSRLFAVILTVLSAFAPVGGAFAQDRPDQEAPSRAMLAFDQIPLSIVYDVATDARTFRLNRGAQLPEAKRGDTFIVEGKIFPAGTLFVGGSLLSPGTFNPDAATGSIGKWVLRGTLNYDFGEIIGGAGPAVFGTQYFLFNDGRVIITDGAHGAAIPQLRAIVGGGGSFSGAAGDVSEEILGTNVTGLFNQRFTFRIKKQSLR